MHKLTISKCTGPSKFKGAIILFPETTKGFREGPRTQVDHMDFVRQ